jgi:hypothetical protein
MSTARHNADTLRTFEQHLHHFYEDWEIKRQESCLPRYSAGHPSTITAPSGLLCRCRVARAQAWLRAGPHIPGLVHSAESSASRLKFGNSETDQRREAACSLLGGRCCRQSISQRARLANGWMRRHPEKHGSWLVDIKHCETQIAS